MRFRLATKPTWPELRARLIAEVPAAYPATAFTFSEDDPVIAWHDGPAEGSIAAVVDDVPGWTVESSLLGPDPDRPTGTGGRVLRFERSFSDAALALAVVRFQASGVRPYERARPGAVERLWAILEEDDPATSGYPLTDAIRDLLVAAPDPVDGPTPPPADPAERWAWKLAALGYDRLWSQAWANVKL